MSEDLGDAQLERYGRQILLPQIDIAGQQCLLNTHILLIGIGGLGSPAAMYLASSGVGKLSLCDFDSVDLSNLHRQIIYTTADIGTPKAESAAIRLRQLNPDIEICAINTSLHGDALTKAIENADLVIDASDNFETRYLINQICVKENKPLVSGSAIKMQGQVSVFNLSPDSPCYECLYPTSQTAHIQANNCNDSGVFPPLTGIIGSIMATEAIKLALKLQHSLDGQLLLINAETMGWRTLTLRPDPTCPICARHTTRKTML